MRITELHLRNVSDISIVFGGVYKAEIIRAWSTLLEVCCENGLL